MTALAGLVWSTCSGAATWDALRPPGAETVKQTDVALPGQYTMKWQMTTTLTPTQIGAYYAALFPGLGWREIAPATNAPVMGGSEWTYVKADVRARVRCPPQPAGRGLFEVVIGFPRVRGAMPPPVGSLPGAVWQGDYRQVDRGARRQCANLTTTRAPALFLRALMAGLARDGWRPIADLNRFGLARLDRRFLCAFHAPGAELVVAGVPAGRRGWSYQMLLSEQTPTPRPP